MRLRKLSPNLGVEDVDRTITYYRDVLEFELILAVPPDGPTDWAVMKCGDIEMMFQSINSLIEDIPALKGRKIGGALDFYIEVQDIEKLYQKLSNKVTIIKPLHATSYGMKEFLMQDCNGFVLAFGEGV